MTAFPQHSVSCFKQFGAITLRKHILFMNAIWLCLCPTVGYTNSWRSTNYRASLQTQLTDSRLWGLGRAGSGRKPDSVFSSLSAARLPCGNPVLPRTRETPSLRRDEMIILATSSAAHSFSVFHSSNLENDLYIDQYFSKGHSFGIDLQHLAYSTLTFFI